MASVDAPSNATAANEQTFSIRTLLVELRSWQRSPVSSVPPIQHVLCLDFALPKSRTPKISHCEGFVALPYPRRAPPPERSFDRRRRRLRIFVGSTDFQRNRLQPGVADRPLMVFPASRAPHGARKVRQTRKIGLIRKDPGRYGSPARRAGDHNCPQRLARHAAERESVLRPIIPRRSQVVAPLRVDACDYVHPYGDVQPWLKLKASRVRKSLPCVG